MTVDFRDTNAAITNAKKHYLKKLIYFVSDPIKNLSRNSRAQVFILFIISKSIPRFLRKQSEASIKHDLILNPFQGVINLYIGHANCVANG